MNFKWSEICDLYELTDATGTGARGVFVLGSLVSPTERLTVASQQTRAINLVHGLKECGSLMVQDRRGADSNSRICVIGAGAAGLTAAAYAIQLGAEATVLDHCAPLWNLRGCRTRWLHPNLFRHWPDPRWHCTGTNLPVMNWYADYACNVGNLLYSKYQSFEAMQSGSARLTLTEEIRIEPAGAAWRVSWSPVTERGDRRTKQQDFACVILAIGFGAESRTRDSEAGNYWLDDSLERDHPHKRNSTFLVSGTGDGGLTDLLRIRVDGFRHHHLRDALLSLSHFEDEIAARVNSIQAAIDRDRNHDPTAEFEQLADAYRPGILLRRLRPSTSVILTNRLGTALASNAWPISRYLAAALLRHDSEYSRYLPGPATWHAHSSAGSPEPHPKGFSVTFRDGISHDVDAIVVRHGASRRSAGTGPSIPWVDHSLQEFGFDAGLIATAREKWTAYVARRQCTDDLLVEPANLEGHRRSRSSVVTPAHGGRTVLGMLSRLMGSVDPEIDDEARGDLRITGHLVSDETAALLTQLSDQIPGSGAGSAPAQDRTWQLGIELDRQSAVEAIHAADRWFRPLWRTPRADWSDFERAWVLPRAPWCSRTEWLRHTRVARHWGQWQLTYHQDHAGLAGVPPWSGKADRELAIRLRTYVRSNWTPDRADRQPMLVRVIDLHGVRMRLAVLSDRSQRATRLARELGANLALVLPRLQAVWLD